MFSTGIGTPCPAYLAIETPVHYATYRLIGPRQGRSPDSTPTMAEITELFSGLELVEPDMTRAVDRWPDGPRSKPAPACCTAWPAASAADHLWWDVGGREGH